MSRILLVGQGPLPAAPGAPGSAHGLRTRQFARALVDGGLEVELLLLDRLAGTAATVEFDAPRERIAIAACRDEDELRRRLATDPRRFAAAVGATSYASYLLASARLELPLWIDLNGDPIAEGQSQAAAAGGDEPHAAGWWLLTSVARRGDRFSVVSTPQRHALLGQLGALGRLGPSTAGADPIAVVPEAVELGPERDGAREPRTVLFSGSFASWVDGATLAAAVRLVLDSAPELRFVATGGPVAGLSEAPWRRFVEALAPLGTERARIPGWLAPDELAAVERDALCGVVPELPSAERELGGQNRSLRWLAAGIPVVTTGLCELGRQIGAEGIGALYPPGDAASLAAEVLELHRRPERRRAMSAAARPWVGRARSVAATTAPLLEWLRAPVPAADRADGGAARRAHRLPEMLRDQLHLEAGGEPGPGPGPEEPIR